MGLRRTCYLLVPPSREGDCGCSKTGAQSDDRSSAETWRARSLNGRGDESPLTPTDGTLPSWSGLRLVLAGYTVARAESLSGKDKDTLRERGFTLDSGGSRRQEPDLDPTWPPTPGGRGPARVCQEPWGCRPFHDGAGLCSPGRWDPDLRTYCSSGRLG